MSKGERDFRGIKLQIDRRLRAQGLVLSEDQTEYVDTSRNVSVVLGAEDLVTDFIEQGYSKSEDTGGPTSKTFHTEAKFQIKMKKMEKAMGTLSMAEQVSESLDFDILLTKAEALLSMGDYRAALRTAETILCTKKQELTAMRVKADSLFNLCDFEHALVMYHKGNKLAPRNTQFEKGIDNCEETIKRLLDNKEVFKSVGTILFTDRLMASLATQTNFSMKILAANKFKTYKEDKIKKEVELIESGKKIKKRKDRLAKDKQFLMKLVKVPGFRPHKRKKQQRSVAAHAKEMLDFLNKRETFWSQISH